MSVEEHKGGASVRLQKNSLQNDSRPTVWMDLIATQTKLTAPQKLLTTMCFTNQIVRH